MALDPSPIALKAAELMDELEESMPEGTALEDALIVVELSYPAEDGSDERWSEVRTKATTGRSVVALGLAEIACEIQRQNDVDED